MVNFKQLERKKKPEKIRDLAGIKPSAMLHELSYEASLWEEQVALILTI